MQTLARATARGKIVVDEARCKGCGLCITVCPKRVLALSSAFTARGYQVAQLVDPEAACTGCILCATICPDAAITVFRQRGPVQNGQLRPPV